MFIYIMLLGSGEIQMPSSQWQASPTLIKTHRFINRTVPSDNRLKTHEYTTTKKIIFFAFTLQKSVLYLSTTIIYYKYLLNFTLTNSKTPIKT